MTEPQIWTMIGAFTALMIGMMTTVSTFFVRILRAEIGGLRSEMRGRFEGVDHRFEAVNHQFTAVNHRLDAMDRRMNEIDRDVQALVKHTFGLDRD